MKIAAKKPPILKLDTLYLKQNPESKKAMVRNPFVQSYHIKKTKIRNGHTYSCMFMHVILVNIPECR